MELLRCLPNQSVVEADRCHEVLDRDAFVDTMDDLQRIGRRPNHDESIHVWRNRVEIASIGAARQEIGRYKDVVIESANGLRQEFITHGIGR